jgi:flagellar protein FliO/FliZ
MLRPRVSSRWLTVGGAVVAGLLVVQLCTGLREGDAPEPAPIANRDGDTTFLAEGYAQLEESGYRFSSAPSVWDIMGSMVIPLLVVIAGAYATIRGLRYLNRRIARTVGSSELLEVIETVSLGGSGMLHLVRIGDRVVVVGAGTGSLSLITELSAEEAERALIGRASEAHDGAILTALLPRFRDVLASRVSPDFRASGAIAPWAATGTRADDSRSDDGSTAPSEVDGRGSEEGGAGDEVSRRFGYWPDAPV